VRALAHEIGNRVSAAYRRSDLFDRRVRPMRDWAEVCVGRDVQAPQSRRTA